MTIKIHDRVYKKSCKPFQSGYKVEQIVRETTMVIPGKGDVRAAILSNCEKPVEWWRLRNDPDKLKFLSGSDK